MIIDRKEYLELLLPESWEEMDIGARRHYISGGDFSDFEKGTVKIDVNNTAVQSVLGKVHTLLSTGTISQFNNLSVKFDLPHLGHGTLFSLM